MLRYHTTVSTHWAGPWAFFLATSILWACCWLRATTWELYFPRISPLSNMLCCRPKQV